MKRHARPYLSCSHFTHLFPPLLQLALPVGAHALGGGPVGRQLPFRVLPRTRLTCIVSAQTSNDSRQESCPMDICACALPHEVSTLYVSYILMRPGTHPCNRTGTACCAPVSAATSSAEASRCSCAARTFSLHLPMVPPAEVLHTCLSNPCADLRC